MTHMHRRGGTWLVAAIIVGVVAAHAVGLYWFSSHVALSATLAGVAILLLVARHLGLFETLYRRLRGDKPRRWPRQSH
jgi:hypothetical protein